MVSNLEHVSLLLYIHIEQTMSLRRDQLACQFIAYAHATGSAPMAEAHTINRESIGNQSKAPSSNTLLHI